MLNSFYIPVQGWSHHREEKLFFFAGDGPASDGDLIGDRREGNMDNLLCCLDLATNTWSKPKTRGTSPSPRNVYAAATIAHRVVIHGGSNLNDTYMLDMESMTWTLISTGGPKASSHSLSLFAWERFLLISGLGASREVWIFNMSNFTWERQDHLKLPVEMGYHRAVATKSRKAPSIVCLGGPSNVKNMVVFDVE